MDVSIWGAVHLHSMDGWALSGADVQAPWHGVLETVWLHCDEAQQVRCLQMSTKPANARATTAIRAGCVRHRWVTKRPSQGGVSEMLPKTHDPTYSCWTQRGWLQTKISVIEQLADKNKAFIIVLQETHCTTADKLVIPSFSQFWAGITALPRLSMSGWNGHWSISLQNNQRLSGWLCVDVAGYKIINVYKPPCSRFTPTAITTFQNPSRMLATSTASMSTGVTTEHLLTVRAWSPGQHPTTLDCCIAQRKHPAFSLTGAQ